MDEQIRWPMVVLMTLIGVVTLWLKQISMAQRTNVPGMAAVSIKIYWVDNWASTLFALTSSVGGLVFLDYLNMLGGKAGPALGFGVGFVANNIADMVGGRVQSLIDAATSARKPQ